MYLASSLHELTNLVQIYKNLKSGPLHSTKCVCKALQKLGELYTNTCRG